MIRDDRRSELGTRGKQPQLAFLQWGRKLQGAKKHASYELYTGSNSKVVQQLLEHDPRTMQYKLSGSAMQMPSSGLSRDYYCAQMHGGYDYIVTGSSSGEMCVFNTNTLVFRACVPVSCGGVHALVTCVIGSPDGGARAIAYCGCGDGHLKMLATRCVEMGMPVMVEALTLIEALPEWVEDEGDLLEAMLILKQGAEARQGGNAEAEVAMLGMMWKELAGRERA